jgi:hypothetical protein
MRVLLLAVLLSVALPAAAQQAGDSWEEAEPESELPPPPPPPPSAPEPPSAPAPPPYAAPPPGWAYPVPGAVPVQFHAKQAGLPFELSRGRDAPAFAHCPGYCALLVPPGEYWLRTLETPTTVEGKRRIKIERASRASVEARTHEDRSSGRTMGYIGVALVAAGAFAMSAGVLQLARNPEEGRGVTLILLGTAGMATGGVLTPIGFVRGFRSAPKVDVAPLGPEPPR